MSEAPKCPLVGTVAERETKAKSYGDYPQQRSTEEKGRWPARLEEEGRRAKQCSTEEEEGRRCPELDDGGTHLKGITPPWRRRPAPPRGVAMEREKPLC
ncbi:hypothetical protein L7F22_021497 [Adiantum nelumboides]|nr:hypothetical protein [Adiantum nelumboides]